MTTTLPTDLALALAQSGIERDTLLYDLTDAETVALLTPLLDKARAAGAAEMQERCAGVADELGGERVERGPDGDLRRFDMESRHGRGDAVLNAMRVRAQTIATAIRSLT